VTSAVPISVPVPPGAAVAMAQPPRKHCDDQLTGVTTSTFALMCRTRAWPGRVPNDATPLE
jgi:hypothetical protein